MCIVGPRPTLFKQDDLIALRTTAAVHELTPGLTCWAQIDGRDEISIAAKVQLDAEYLRRRPFSFDLLIMARPVREALVGHGVPH